MAVLHGRPLEVMPRQVQEGSLESVRLTRDSGVLATKGIAVERGSDSTSVAAVGRGGAEGCREVN